MKPVLRGLHSPDVQDLVGGVQDPDDFGFLLQLLVGPENQEGEESFDVVVCSPKWFSRRLEDAPVSGRHHLFMKRYDYSMLERYLVDFLERCQGDSWAEVARLVGRLGAWEFDDYVPAQGDAAHSS